jgi:NAD+---dinitrogen-reductase ADP-D-ribosyltransferase
MNTHELAEQLNPRHWYTTNLVGVSSQLLASIDFNDFPQRLWISGTRPSHKGLFALLATSRSQVESADMFAEYMEAAFSLAKRASPTKDGTAHYTRSSYSKLLQGWGFDSNGQPGAVLKGWVESRFGIVPTFHHFPLENFPSDAWIRYLEEKLSSRFHNNCIQLQLDILYEYAQWSIERHKPFENSHVTVYRGMNASEAQFHRGSLKERHGVIRLNNLVSFSHARERAGEFGDIVVCAKVPFAKIFLFPGLLDEKVLSGEDELLVIGGDFEVHVSEG